MAVSNLMCATYARHHSDEQPSAKACSLGLWVKMTGDHSLKYSYNMQGKTKEEQA